MIAWMISLNYCMLKDNCEQKSMIKVKGKLQTWYYFHVHGIFANYWFDTKKVLRAEGSPFIYTSVILFTIIFQFFSSVTWIATRMCNLNLWVILPFEVFALSIFCMICHLQECSTFKFTDLWFVISDLCWNSYIWMNTLYQQRQTLEVQL